MKANKTPIVCQDGGAIQIIGVIRVLRRMFLAHAVNDEHERARSAVLKSLLKIAVKTTTIAVKTKKATSNPVNEHISANAA